MSTSGGPKIPTTGLVLNYDPNNIKSFRGEETVNLVTPDFTDSSWGPLNITTSLTTDYVISTGGKVYEVTIQDTGSTTKYRNGNTSSGPLSPNSATTHSFTVYAKNHQNLDLNVNIDIGDGAADGENLLNETDWVRFKAIGTGNATDGTRDFVDITFSGTFNNGDTFLISSPQVEQKDHATRFVSGSRGSTVATGGGFIDLSRSNNNGELISVPEFDEVDKNSMQLDGVDDTINFNYDLRRDFTFQCWVKIDIVDGFCFLGNGTTTTNNGLHIWYRSATALRFGMYSNDMDATGLTTNTDQWYSYTFTYTHESPYTKQIFRNGELLNSGGGNAYSGSGVVRIGATYSSGGDFASGSFGPCRLYNRVLSDEEIRKSYLAQKSRFGL